MASSVGAIRAGRAFIEIFADDSKLNQGLRRAAAKLKAFGTSMSTLGRSMMTTAAIAAFPFAMATRRFREFDDEMRFVQATTQAVGAEFDMLTKKARELGRTTSFTAQQVASGMAELGKQGFSPREVEAAIEHVMNLSRATRTNLPTSVQIATTALRAFGISASETEHVADVLVTAANNSSTSLTELGEAFQYASANMDLAGESVENVATIMAVLATGGLRGSMAGTALNQVVNQLADKDVIARLKEMNIEVGEIGQNGKVDMRDIASILLDYGEYMSQFGELEQLQSGKQIFNIRGARAGLRFANNPEIFDRMRKSIDESAGAAKKAADLMDAGIGGVWRRLISAFQDMQIEVTKRLLPSLIESGEKMKRIIVGLSKWVAANGKAIGTITEMIVALGALGTVFFVVGKLASAFGVILTMLSKITTMSLWAMGGAMSFIIVGVLAITTAWLHAKAEGIAYGEAILDLTHKITGLGNAYTRLRDEEAKTMAQHDRLADFRNDLAKPAAAKSDDALKKARIDRNHQAAQLATTEQTLAATQKRLATAKNSRFNPMHADLSKRTVVESAKQAVLDATVDRNIAKTHLREMDIVLQQAQWRRDFGMLHEPQSTSDKARALADTAAAVPTKLNDAKIRGTSEYRSSLINAQVKRESAAQAERKKQTVHLNEIDDNLRMIREARENPDDLPLMEIPPK